MHFIIVSTVCVSPGSRKTCEPPIDAANSLVDTLSSKVIFLLCSASNMSSSVIILVMLAGTSSVSFSFSNKILPLLFSIRTADLASMDTLAWAEGGSLAAGWAAANGFVLHITSESEISSERTVFVKMEVFVNIFIIPHFYRNFLDSLSYIYYILQKLKYAIKEEPAYI